MKKVIILILLLQCTLLAQKEANIWYFGNKAGLDFNSGTPVALTNSSLNTFEGVATICDKNGSLLFYTDGITVYNKNHAIMQNGTGLKGNYSATQSGIIVPNPGNTSIFYVFTVTDLGRSDGLNYSVVDISKNGGFGEVVTKNQFLYSPTCEKVTAVKHSNGIDIWVITHDWTSNAFRTYLVTSAGVSATPVISNVGVVHGTDSWNTIGYLKASPDGKKIVTVMYNMNSFEILDFNSSTGQLSNPITMNDNDYTGLYGAEFSPDSKLLYIGKHGGNSKIMQFDITSNNLTLIKNSMYVLYNYTGGQFGALQLAPDEKIYAVKYNIANLSVINNPNTKGSGCGFSFSGVDLASRTAGLGLPTFIQSYFDFTLKLSSNSEVCEGDTLRLYCDSVPGASYSWSGPMGFNSIIRNPIRTNALPGMSGYYKIIVTANSLAKTDSIYVQVNSNPVADAGADKEVCRGSSVTLDGSASSGAGKYIYIWSPSAGLDDNTLEKPVASPDSTTSYFLTVQDMNGCYDRDTVLVIVNNNPKLSLGNDTSACEGGAVLIGADADGGTAPYTYNWQPDTGLSETNKSLVMASPTISTVYTLFVTDSKGCTTSDSILVDISPLPVADAGKDSSACAGTPVQIGNEASGGSSPYFYSWDPPDFLADANSCPTIAYVPDTMKYVLTVTDSKGCTDTDTVWVYTLPGPDIDAGPDMAVCIGGAVQIGNDASGGQPPYTYLWSPSDGLSDPTIAKPTANPTTTTSYYLQVEDVSGCMSFDTVIVVVNPLPIAHAGADTSICDGSFANIGYQAENGTPPYKYKWEPDIGLSANNLPVVQASPHLTTTYIVSVTDNADCISYDTVSVYVRENPVPLIASTGSLEFCSCNEGVTLYTEASYDSYLWSTGETTDSIFVNTAGEYYVTVTNDNGCSGVSNTVSVIILQPVSSVSLNNTDMKGMPGDKIKIPLQLLSSEYLDECNALNYEAVISFNRSILVPAGDTPKGIIENGRRIITISGTRSLKTGLLSELDFIVTLGNDTATTVDIESFEWVDCPHTVPSRGMNFELDGLCREGGSTRLFFSEPPDVTFDIHPNPINNKGDINFVVLKDRFVKIELIDSRGESVRFFYNTEASAGEHKISFNTDGIQSGLYLVRLIAGNNIVAKRVMVIK